MKKSLFWIAILFLVVTTWKLLLRPALDRIPPINEATKTCLITGASSGIGLEISREMVRRGWKVVGVARRWQVLERISSELGEAFIPHVCDVSDMGQVASVCEKVKSQGLKPTLFFLNAGTGGPQEKYKPFFQTHKTTFATNYFGAIAWVEQWLNDVKKLGGGTFVATSSVMSLFAPPNSAAYSASKSALNACFQSLRLQYRNDGIGFVLVLPGPVDTKMLKVPEPVPFTHDPADEGKYIVEQVFRRRKQIEPSWVYSFLLRLASWLPDGIVARIV